MFTVRIVIPVLIFFGFFGLVFSARCIKIIHVLTPTPAGGGPHSVKWVDVTILPSADLVKIPKNTTGFIDYKALFATLKVMNPDDEHVDITFNELVPKGTADCTEKPSPTVRPFVPGTKCADPHNCCNIIITLTPTCDSNADIFNIKYETRFIDYAQTPIIRYTCTKEKRLPGKSTCCSTTHK